MNALKWEGVYSALLTPFDSADNIDFKLFEKNIDAQMTAGIDALSDRWDRPWHLARLG